jgi:hypothetical protein
MHFPMPFTRNEISWFLMKAKSHPISDLDGNWHGDNEGDPKLVFRLSLSFSLSSLCAQTHTHR